MYVFEKLCNNCGFACILMAEHPDKNNEAKVLMGKEAPDDLC